MTKRPVASTVCGAFALSLAGCSAAFAPPSESSPPPMTLLSVADGLGQADRVAAYDAQVEALDSGERRSWRGADGAFGFVEPGAAGETERGYCRAIAETIYFDGWPRRGQGQACRRGGGSWRLTG